MNACPLFPWPMAIKIVRRAKNTQKLRLGFIEADCGNFRTTTAYDQSLHPLFPLSFYAHTN